MFDFFSLTCETLHKMFDFLVLRVKLNYLLVESDEIFPSTETKNARIGVCTFPLV